jgi:hypothetical protein
MLASEIECHRVRFRFIARSDVGKFHESREKEMMQLTKIVNLSYEHNYQYIMKLLQTADRKLLSEPVLHFQSLLFNH